MRIFTFEQIAGAMHSVVIDPNDAYILSYREIVEYFKHINNITNHEFMIGSLCVFGWLATAIKFRGDKNDIEIAVEALNNIKHSDNVKIESINVVKKVVNNSMVGTSKLLHFIMPDRFPIIDRRVYTFINGNYSQKETAKVENYMIYLGNSEEVVMDARFEDIQKYISRKVGYDISPFRAVELIMFSSLRRK